MRRRFSVLLCLLAASCSAGDPCSNTASCPVRMQCIVDTPQERGYCAPCDPVETPYDGIDNDCLARTSDVDIDGDGDNWDGAPINPGTDCDDGDPTVSGRRDEICDDRKDNDCDGVTDEPDCGDTMAPIIRFTAPTAGSILYETIEVILAASDDVGVVYVELIGPRGVQLGRRTSLPYTFVVDTTALEDGAVLLEASATDVVGLRSVARLTVEVDNAAGPVVTVRDAPTTGARYGGQVPLDLTATDPSGVARIDVEVDDIRVATSSLPVMRTSFDSRAFRDGDHDLTIISVDDRGSIRRTLYELTLDNTPPVITFVQPQNMATVPPGVLAVDVTATDPSQVLATWIGPVRQQGSSLTTTIAAAPGPLTITASAADVVIVDGILSGNVGAASVTVQVQ